VIESLFQDLKFGARVLRKNPGFTAIAVLTLALGIGANTAIFSVIYEVLLKPLPFPASNQIVSLYETNAKGTQIGTSRLDYFDWKSQARSFSAMGAYYFGMVPLKGEAEPQYVPAVASTPEVLQILQLSPVLGRGMTADSVSNGEALISAGLWKGAFGGRSDVIGSKITAERKVYTIVGVVPDQDDFAGGAELWLPLDLASDNSDRSAHNYWVLGRIRPGVRLEEAQSELSAIAKRLSAEYPDSNKRIGATLLRLQDANTQQVRPTLVLLSTMLVLVLLIACVNVGNLLLVRAANRSHEMAVREALGANFLRRVRQLLVESVVLFLFGGAAGLLLSYWLGAGLFAILPGLPADHSAGFGPAVLMFTAAISLLCGIVFGIVPAWQLRQTNLALSQSARVVGGKGEWARKCFIASEVALCFVLLVGAGVTTKSLLRMQGVELGFRPDNLLVVSAPMEADLPPKSDPAPRQEQFLQGLAQIPGVKSVAATDAVPMTDGGSNGNFMIEGESTRESATWKWAAWRTVDENFFQVLGIPLLRGRVFQPTDRRGEEVVVINRTLADLYWPGQDPIGKHIAIPGWDQQTYDAFRAGGNLWFTVIGVVGDIKDSSVTAPPRPNLYVPYFRHSSEMQALVRTSLPAQTLLPSIKKVSSNISPNAPVKVTSMESILHHYLAAPRLRSYLLTCFALLALLLAMIGIYGVVAYSTARRTAEFGVRAALGATPSSIIAMVVKGGFILIAPGLIAGLVLVFAVHRLLDSFLFNVSSTDPVVMAAIAAVVLAISFLASYVPARRASKIDPMEALRYE